MTTRKELQERLDLCRSEYERKRFEVSKAFALEDNPVKIGDMVTDHYHTIKVKKFGISSYPYPTMVYIGIEMTKKGEPKKRQENNPVYQQNIRIINGKAYTYKQRE